MKALFIKVKPASILLLLKDSQQAWYPSKLARSSGVSYVHTVNLLSSLRALGVVLTEKKGKQNMYKLTEKGAQLASVLDDFAKKCDAAAEVAKTEPPSEQSSSTTEQKSA